MKASLLCLSLPIAAALAFAPSPAPVAQNPQDENPEVVNIMPISELQYVTLNGKSETISSTSVVEIRIFNEQTDRIRLELLYDNGDYSLMDVQTMHILRKSGITRDVRLVRSKRNAMRFPNWP